MRYVIKTRQTRSNKLLRLPGSPTMVIALLKLKIIVAATKIRNM